MNKCLLLIMFLAISLVSGCSGITNIISADKDNSDIDSSDLARYSEEFGDSSDLKNLNYFEEQELLDNLETSFDLIQKAQDEDKITKEDAMILTLVAGFQPEELPKAYHSEETEPRSNLQEAENWLAVNYETLDEKTKKALEPYYVLPNDPKSYLNQKSIGKEISDRLSIIPSVKAEAITWNGMEVNSGFATAMIFYQDEDADNAEYVREAFQKSTVQFDPLLGVQIPKTLIFIMPMSDLGVASFRVIDGVTHGYVRLNQDQTKKGIQSTTAHEIFHIYQNALGMDFKSNTRWLREVTAVWSEDFVYPEYNGEQRWLPRFYRNLGKDMVHFGNRREYASYPWAFFLEQYYDDPAIIKEMLVNSLSNDARNAATIDLVEQPSAFAELFSEYAFWNWNILLGKKYQDHKGFPGNPIGEDSFKMFVFDKDKEEKTVSIETEELSTQYLGFVFKDGGSIEIDFGEIAKSNIKRRALIKLNDGGWSEQDWSNIKKKKFCRDRLGEDVRSVVLIISNADLYQSYDDVVDVIVEESCEPIWHGTTTLTWDTEETHEAKTMLGDKGSIKIVTKGKHTMTDELKMSEEDEDFTEMSAAIVSTTINYQSFDQTTKIWDKSCGLVKHVTERTKTGTVTLDFTDEEYGPERFTFNSEYPEEGMNWNVDASAEDDWITVKTTSTKTYNQCAEQIITDSDSTTTTERSENYIRFWPIENVLVDIPFDDSISGAHDHLKSRKVFDSDTIDYVVDVEYDYEYK